MCARMLAKVMKYELRYLDGCGSFSELQERLWWLQRQTARNPEPNDTDRR